MPEQVARQIARHRAEVELMTAVPGATDNATSDVRSNFNGVAQGSATSRDDSDGVDSRASSFPTYLAVTISIGALLGCFWAAWGLRKIAAGCVKRVRCGP